MPILKINHIVSFSSEDPLHCANNLLSSDPSKKWKCANPGEKSASVVLQLEKASIISAIDIGNEHSAYVEVLVSRSSSSDDFKILLVMSSFMTPLESKQSINVNKVRMFSKDQLQDPECKEKWDRIKIVCTQPFNRHVQYGLSFVTFHSPEQNENSSGIATIGKYLLRPESPDNISAGSLFARRKELSEDSPLTGAAAIRQASSLALNGSPVTKTKLKDLPSTSKNKTFSDSVSTTPKERNRKEILYDKDDEEPNEKIDKLIEKKKKEDDEKKKTEMSEKENTKQKKKDSNDTTPKVKVRKKDEGTPSPTKRDSIGNKRKVQNKNSPNKKLKVDVQRKPFHRLLEGVVLVISGIQNPERADIRSKALEMGSKYKPDWDNSCTHLICAFPNTPKFNYVKGKGKIVTKNWILDCYSQRKRFPWRRYALDKKDAGKPESESEIWEDKEEEREYQAKEVMNEINENSGSDTEDEIEKVQALQQKILKEMGSSENKKEAFLHKDKEMSIITKEEYKMDISQDAEEQQEDDGSKDEEMEKDRSKEKKTESKTDISQEDDVSKDEEIEKDRNKETETEMDISQEQIEDKEDDAFFLDTEEEEIPEISKEEVEFDLPEFFDHHVFYIDKDMEIDNIKELERYITAYKGYLVKDPSDVVDIVITNKKNKSSFADTCPEAKIVDCSWVWECHNNQQLVSVENYQIK